MSMASKTKIEMAIDALSRATDQLSGNAYDPVSRKYARQQLSKAETWIKEARAAMRQVNEKDDEPKPEEEKQQAAQHDDAQDVDAIAEEVDHDDNL